MGTLVFFLCYKAVLFYCDGIRLGIRNLIAEESLIIPRLQRYLPFGDVLYFFTCFDGIVKSIGEQGTEAYIIDSQQSVNGNIEKQSIFLSSAALYLLFSTALTILFLTGKYGYSLSALLKAPENISQRLQNLGSG